MDRNTLIGFLLLGLLLFGYFYYIQQGRQAFEMEKQRVADSVNSLKPRPDSMSLPGQTEVLPQTENTLPAGILQDSAVKEEFYTVNTKITELTFTNKGGQPYKVRLKDYKTFGGEELFVDDGSENNISYSINTGTNHTAETSDLYFTRLPDQQQDSNIVVTYALQTTGGSTIEHQYIISPDNYMIDFNIKIKNGNGLFTNQVMRMNWAAKATQKERDLDWEITQSHVSFVENNDFDFEHLGVGTDKEKKFDSPVEWIALNQQFFINFIEAKDKFESGLLKWNTPKDTSGHIVGLAEATMQLKVPSSADAIIPMQLYYGPSDYAILKSYNNQMYNMVQFGYGIFAFVKYINRGFILPIFNFLAKFMSNFGLIIALMTIIIRLLISPLTYQSYLSGAKMKLLRPELDELKKKFGEDKQGFAMEQMKLYKSAGASPLGGCVPALFQIPIFFALYAFFNSNIALRGQGFLWTTDLSSYDSILSFGFNIPFYGSHVSLFTILATITSLGISLYGMANMQTPGNNPMMKYIPFIFPIFLLGVFNRMPSALTWYYTVSNVITLAIQFVIQTYIIDHDKIMAKLQENKKKPQKQSKWQERIDAMQKQNDRLKQMRARVDNNKKR